MRGRARRRRESRSLICVQQALQRGNQIGSGAGFADEAVRAQKSDGGFGLGRTFLHGEKEDFGRGGDTSNFEGRLYAVHHRHIDVEQHQLRIERLYLVERLLPVCRFAADAYGVRIQERADRMPRDVVVINEKNSGRKSPSGSLSPVRRERRAIVLPFEHPALYSNACRVFKIAQICFSYEAVSSSVTAGASSRPLSTALGLKRKSGYVCSSNLQDYAGRIYRRKRPKPPNPGPPQTPTPQPQYGPG
jgi:hypothetical protein